MRRRDLADRQPVGVGVGHRHRWRAIGRLSMSNATPSCFSKMIA
jgi:hypothetical protein